MFVQVTVIITVCDSKHLTVLWGNSRRAVISPQVKAVGLLLEQIPLFDQSVFHLFDCWKHLTMWHSNGRDNSMPSQVKVAGLTDMWCLWRGTFRSPGEPTLTALFKTFLWVVTDLSGCHIDRLSPVWRNAKKNILIMFFFMFCFGKWHKYIWVSNICLISSCENLQ